MFPQRITHQLQTKYKNQSAKALQEDVMDGNRKKPFLCVCVCARVEFLCLDIA